LREPPPLPQLQLLLRPATGSSRLRRLSRSRLGRPSQDPVPRALDSRTRARKDSPREKEWERGCRCGGVGGDGDGGGGGAGVGAGVGVGGGVGGCEGVPVGPSRPVDAWAFPWPRDEGASISGGALPLSHPPPRPPSPIDQPACRPGFTVTKPDYHANE
jgi:hypothetical protein